MHYRLVLRGKGESSSGSPSMDAIKKDLKGTGIFGRFQLCLAVSEHPAASKLADISWNTF